MKESRTHVKARIEHTSMTLPRMSSSITTVSPSSKSHETTREQRHAEVNNGIFRFWIDVPLSLGTVGGITTLHPMVKFSHQMLGQPNAPELMEITAAAGLAQNFSAIRSLVTTGIQKGHMKMHLLNILNQLEATEKEKAAIIEYFKDKVPSYQNTVEIFCKMRGIANLKI